MLKKMLSLPCGGAITDITCFPARTELLLQRRCTRGRCPECNQLSTSHYGFTSRKPQHMPAGGKMLLLHFRLQRFRCQNVQCQRLTFQQSIISIAQKYQRNTYNLNSLLVRYSLICGGEAGSRLAQLNGIRIRGDTLIRRLKTRGFKGSMTTVRYIVSEWRTAIPEEHRALQLPAVNQIVQWLLYPEEVTDLQKQELIMKIKKSSPVISRGSELTRRFISLFSKRDSNAPATLLQKWQTDALSSGMD